MVAIVSGNGLGVLNGSAGVLGQSGLFGKSTYGSSGEAAYVNAANGNLVVNDRDEWLASVGINLALTRTYNSLGNLSTGNGLNWRTGPAKLISGLTGTLNTAGSTVTRTDADGSTQLYTYDSAKGVYRSTDGDGAYDVLVGTAAGWTWQGKSFDKSGVFETYDAAGRLIGAGDHGTNRITYAYNADGQLDTVTDASGDVTRYVYDNKKLARISSQVAGAGSQVRTYYEYDDLGRLKAATIDMTPEDGSIADGNVYRTTYEYHGTGSQLKQLKQSDGSEQNFTYTAAGKVETVTDALGRVTRFNYDVPGRTSVTDPAGAVTVYAYDTNGQLTSVTAPAINGTATITSLYYDTAGNLIRTVSPTALETVYGYDANGNRTLERDATGKTVTRVYDLATNLLTSETTYTVADPDGAGALQPSDPMTRRFFYDAGKLLRFAVSAEGRVTEYRYNALNQLASELQYNRVPTAAESTSMATLNTWATSTALSQLATRVEYAYDGRGQLKTATSNTSFTSTGVANGIQTVLTYNYDPAGQLVMSTDGNGNTNRFAYDELGRRLTQTDANGTVRTTVYDDLRGTMTVTTTADPTVSAIHTFDKAGQLTSVRQAHDGVAGTTQNFYDANGRLRMSRDPLGLLAHVLYDAAGRKVAEVANKSLVEYVYNLDGLLVSTIRYATDIDPAKLVDAAGKPLATTLDAIRPATVNAADRKSVNAYDKAGRLVASVDAMGYLTRMEYDGAGRLVRSTARAKAIDLALIGGNAIPAVIANEASSDDRVTRVFYDRDGNVTARLDASGYLSENVYNPSGKLTKTVTRLGVVADATLRSSGTLAQLQTAAGATSATQRFIYDGRGQLVGSIDAAGYLTEITYDAAGNVATRRQYAIAVTAPDALTLATVGKKNDAADRMTTYTYTKRNQVESEATLGGDFVRYAYDANGKQTTVTRGTAGVAERTALRRFDGAGQLTAELSEEGAAKIAALGADPGAAAVAAIWATYAIQYSYDLDGNRTSMTDALGNRTLYVYNEGRLAATVNAVGDWESRTYDAFGDLIEVARYTTPLNATQIATVAASGRLGDLPTTGAALYTKYYYDNEGRQAYVAEADGAVRKNVYDAFDQVTQTLQYRTRLSQVVAAIGNRGHVNAATTDLAAALTGTAGSGTARAYYDATGHLIYTVDATNAVTGRTYDAQGNVKSITRFDTAAGALTGTSADLATLAALAKAGRDRTQTFTYDARGLALDATDAAGFHTVTHFNAFGQLDRATRYGVAGSLASSVLDVITQTLYDQNGRVKATVDGTGTVTTFSYDGDGHVTEQITFAKLIATSSTEAAILAAIGGQTLSDPARDLRQRFVYDANGRLAATLTLQHDGTRANAADPSTSAGTWNVVAQTYDAAGRVAQRSAYAAAFASADLKPSAASVNAWLAARASASVADSAGDSIVRYAYDDTGRVTGTAIAQRVEEGQRVWTIARVVYDSLGNVARRTQFAATLRSASPTADEIDRFNAAAPANSYDAVTVYNYDAMGRVTATATALNSVGGVPQWAIATRNYDAAGNLLSTKQFANAYAGATPPAVLKSAVSVDLWRDRLTRYSYDGANRLVATVDANGAATRLDYDSSGNVIKSTQYTTIFGGTADLPADYRPAGVVGRVTRTFYDLNNRPAVVIGADGAAVARTFDAAGNVTSEVAYATQVTVADTATLADVRALLLTKVTTADRKQYFVYDGDGRPQLTIDALGNLSEKQYDTLGRVVYERVFATPVTIAANATDAQIASTARSSAQTQQAATTTRTTRYVFNAAGNLESVTDALGKTESYTYDALGHKTSFTNKLGATWLYEYDAAGRLVKETSPKVGTYANGLDAVIGNWGAALTQALITTMEYDALGNLVRRTETPTTYDAQGNVVVRADAASTARSTEYRYDALGRQVQTILPPVSVYDSGKDTHNVWIEQPVAESMSASRTVTVRYDALGNAVSNVDVGGRASYKVYDNAGHVRFEIDAANYVTEYQYDIYGQVLSMTRYGNAIEPGATDLGNIDDSDFPVLLRPDSGSDRTIGYAYDSAGRKVRTSEPVVTVYDSHSTNGSAYVSAGRTTVNEYNAFGEVYRQSVFGANAAGTQVTEAAVTRYYYNVRGEKTAQIATLSDIGGQRRGYLTTFVYDAAGNLKEQLEYANEFGTWTDTTYSAYAASTQDRKISYEYDALNRKKSEMRVNVSYAGSTKDATLSTANLVTRFDYDDIGNQTVVTDATGAKTFTYFDAMGHVRATAHKQATAYGEIEDKGIKLTEFKVDAFGNVVLRIDFADAAVAADATGYTATLAMAQNQDNRITATRYDNWGRALETLDPEQFAAGRQSTKMSYDVYGRVSKQWRTVTNAFGAKMTSFQVMGYDELGRVNTIVMPGIIDLVNNTTGASNVRTTQYNAFGEVTTTYLAADRARTEVYTRYDQAGNAWLSNNDKGVHTVRLYDVQGNVTSVIQSTSETANEFMGLGNASEALAKDAVLRTDNRYDLLNHMIDSRVVPDSRLTVLVRENEAWVRKTVARDSGIGESLLVIGDATDATMGIGVRYRTAGGAWTQAAAQRVRVIDGSPVFDTAGLPAGDYEYEVILTPAGEASFSRLGGTLRIAHPVDPERDRQIVQMYLMLFNRAPDLAGLNFWLDSANLGTSTAAMFSGMLQSSEAIARLTGTAADIIAKIFREAFGSTQVPAGDTPQQIAHWTERYAAATTTDGTSSREQRGLVLADLLAYVNKANNAAALVLNNRAAAIRNYVVVQRGSDATVAAELMQQAPADLTGAIAKGTEQGTLERNRIALIEMYVALFGRAPDQGGLTFWTDAMTKGLTIEQAAESMLNSPEATQTWLYPTAGLTPQQYNEQLVNRAYSLSLGRNPNADELAGWLTKLNAGTLGRGPFVAQFVNQVAKYTGNDAARIADRNLFVNKVSVSYTAVVTAGGVLPPNGAGTALLAGITSAATAQEAAEKALLAARAAVELAKNANNAAGIAAGATPLEDIRRSITRLYLAILGRVPDKAGMDFYVPATPYTREQWNSVTLGFLNSTEAQGFLGDWKTMDKATFVRKLYQNALGTIPAGAVVQKEMADYVARLNSGATNAEIAYEIATRMLTSPYLGTDELAAEAVLNNKTAVGLTAGLTLTLADTATQRTVLSLVTATDFTAALNYAYSGSQTALTNKLNQLRDTATAAGTLSDLMSTAATAEAAARAANTTLQASPAAVYRLQVTQLYVALLGRNATNPPDAAGVQFYVNNNATLEQVITGFMASAEGLPLFPASLGNAAFVDKVVAQVLGNASLVGAVERAAWTAQLSATPPATRSKIALDIVNSVLNYNLNAVALNGNADYLTARGNLLQRVSDAFVKLDEATAAEVTRITNLRASLKSSLDTLTAQLTPLQTAMNSADTARTSALSAATTAINNANNTGDATAAKRLTIVRMYATLLQRKAGYGPTLADTEYYLRATPEAIAQAFIDSPEGRTYFPAGSSNAAFITQLYSTILGRSPAQSDIDYYSNALTQNASTPNIRGVVAAGIIENFFVNYTDNAANQLTYKKAMDDKIAGFLTVINSSAATASSNASAVLTEATRLSNAISTAQTAKTNAETAVTNATAGYNDGQAMLAGSRTAIEQVYAALRGSADYGGALFWLRGISSGQATINDLMNGILNGEYPADPAAFVGRLYQITLGRTAAASEINYYVPIVNGNGRLYVAQQIMNSPEGKGVWGPKVTTIDAALVARARADIKIKTDADAALVTAKNNLSTAQTNYANYGWTVASATTARDAAARVATTTSNLVSAHRSVVTADEKYLAYVNAKIAYDAKKAEWDPVNAKYQAALAEPLTQYQAAAALGTTIRNASAAFATAAKALPPAVLASTPAKVQAQQLTQLYFTVLNRAPTLSELYFAIDRMAERATMADIADTLLRSAEGVTRYPASQTNDAFVRQLYTVGLGRTADAGGLKFYMDQLTAGVSRAELAARFIQSVDLSNNSDTTTFTNRASTMLKTLGTTTVTSTMVDAIIDAGADLARQKTVTFDAAAAAALAASPEAQRTTQLTRLYVTILNRTPDLGGLNFYANAMRNNASITVDAVAQLLLDSPEGQRLLPNSLSATAFVGKIFEMAMGRAATSAELTQYAGMLPANTRGKVVNSIINAVLGYKGTDRVQQATQMGFVAKMSLALNEVAGLAATDDTANQAAIALLDRAVKLGVKTLYMADPVVALANVQQGSQGLGGTNLITVDRWGNIVAMADQRDPNFRITYQYNHNNQLVSQSRNARAGDAVVSASTRYDALGRVVAQVDYNGNKNVTTYDSEGNVRREYHADGGIVTSSYNLFGNRLSVQQPDTVVNGTAAPGVLTQYSYDHLGNLKSTTYGTVNVYHAQLVGDGTFHTDYLGTRTLVQSFVYDELGRQIRNTGTDGVSTVLEYDLDGNVIASATQATPGSALLYRTVTVFDAQHQKVAMRDANNNTMTWTYDHGRMVSSFDMGKATTTYGYDQAGRLVTQTSTRGQDLRYTFTGANLTRIEDKATYLTTSYTYDANGNRLTEQQYYPAPLANLPSRVQNNTLRYDWQNRLVSVKDDVYTLTYKYDNNGNRTQITTQYGSTTLQSYNAYDAMNRQTVVNGDWDGTKAVFGERGHAIAYDKSGNRLSDTFKGVKVGYNGSYTTTAGQTTTEYYTYDAMGRLETTRRDVLTIDVRRYDAAGRITQSGLLNKGGSDVGNALKELGIGSAGRIYSYDVGGHITRQKELKADLGVSQDTYFVTDQWNPGGGYDAMGNLTGYTVVIPGTKRGSNGRYIIKYSLFDSYKEESTTLATNNTTNISHYDVNGNRTSITKGVLETVVVDPGEQSEYGGIVGQTFEERVRDTGEVINRLWYDADGHIQSHTAGGATEFNLIVNGQVYGEETQTEDNILGSNYLGVTSATLAAAPSSYSVQSNNETLQGIAQSIWGDANLWYLIADANALGSDAKLTAGQVLRIPTRVNTVHGDYGTYKPYDPSEQIGSTAPVMPAPSGGKGGCGGLGQIVMIVVAVVATIYTAGLAAGAMGVTGGAFSAGLSVMAGTATVGGVGIGAAASFGLAAVGGAVGSIASQAVGIATGVQDGFNWKGVALSALGAGVGAGVAAGASSLGNAFVGTGPMAQAARAALGSAISQKVAVATGLQEHFDWRSVAASAAGAAVGAKLGANKAFQDAFSFSDVARSTVSGIVTGTVASVVRGGKVDIARIATDAFGNALGSSLAAEISSPSLPANMRNLPEEQQNRILDMARKAGVGRFGSDADYGILKEASDLRFSGSSQDMSSDEIWRRTSAYLNLLGASNEQLTQVRSNFSEAGILRTGRVDVTLLAGTTVGNGYEDSASADLRPDAFLGARAMDTGVIGIGKVLQKFGNAVEGNLVAKYTLEALDIASGPAMYAVRHVPFVERLSEKITGEVAGFFAQGFATAGRSEGDSELGAIGSVAALSVGVAGFAGAAKSVLNAVSGLRLSRMTASTASRSVGPAAGIHPDYWASVSGQVNIQSSVRALRQSGSPEALATAKLIKRGNVRVLFKETDPHGQQAAGRQPWGSNKVEVYMDQVSNPTQAAGIIAHETKHYLQGISPTTYRLDHEMEAYMWQRAADPAFARATTVGSIRDFVETNSAYRGVTWAPNSPWKN